MPGHSLCSLSLLASGTSKLCLLLSTSRSIDNSTGMSNHVAAPSDVSQLKKKYERGEEKTLVCLGESSPLIEGISICTSPPRLPRALDNKSMLLLRVAPSYSCVENCRGVKYKEVGVWQGLYWTANWNVLFNLIKANSLSPTARAREGKGKRWREEGILASHRGLALGGQSIPGCSSFLLLVV